MKNCGCKNHKIKIEKKKIIKLYDTIGMIIDQVVAMSESPEVCQFSSTEAISTHCYNVPASN